jgi:hypothetical protein
MAKSIIWKLDVNFVAGPKLSESSELVVEAIDIVDITVGAGAEKMAELQPGGEDQIRFLLIKASHYNKLWYKVASKAIELDGLQLFMGKGITDALGSPVQSVHFKNNSDTDANIYVLVGRMATPPPADDMDGNGGDADSGDSTGDDGNAAPDSTDVVAEDDGTS